MVFEIYEDEDLEPDQVILRNKYKEAELNGNLFNIAPFWATKIDEIEDYSFSGFSDNRSYCEVVVSDLYYISDFIGLSLPMFDKNWPSESRYISTLERWSMKLPVDPPSISQILNDKVHLVDGRHRMILAYVLKAETMIVSVPNKLIPALSEMISVKVLQK